MGRFLETIERKEYDLDVSNGKEDVSLGVDRLGE